MFSSIRICAIVLTALLCVPSVGGATLEQAKSLYLQGRYAEALPTFERLLKAKPKDATLNHWTGVCQAKAGRYAEAKSKLKYAASRKVIESPRYLAEIAFYEYHPELAMEYVEEYRAMLEKNKRDMPEEAQEMIDRIEKMRSMMMRVENIVIVDSIVVDRDEFFRAYRLAPECGTLSPVTVLPPEFDAAASTSVYVPQDGASMFWGVAETDPESEDAGRIKLVECDRLIDGSWDKPVNLGEDLNMGGDANFPYLMSDGVTLYYASTGSESLGGYDIFISRRNDDGRFFGPQNMGMPYNSPYDDYLLAIDDVTGMGWWATDRNHLEGKVTIYKFIPADLRINHTPDEPKLSDFARVASIRDTWPDGADYTELLAKVAEIDGGRTTKNNDYDFELPFADGRVYHYWSDFKSPVARQRMEEYVDRKAEDADDRARLEELRLAYADGDTSTKSEILSLEKRLLTSQAALRRLSNDIYRIEK